MSSEQDYSGPLKNQRHEAFAVAYAGGKHGTEAYRSISGGDKISAPQIASKWLMRNDVIGRVKYLQCKNTTKTMLDMQERRNIAAEIARNSEEDPTVRLRAIELDAKLAGDFVTRVEVDVEHRLSAADVLAAVRRSPLLIEIEAEAVLPQRLLP